MERYTWKEDYPSAKIIPEGSFGLHTKDGKMVILVRTPIMRNYVIMRVNKFIAKSNFAFSYAVYQYKQNNFSISEFFKIPNTIFYFLLYHQ